MIRPELELFANISIYGRPDMVLEEFYWWDAGLLAGLEFRALPWLEPKLSLGVVYDRAFRLIIKGGETSAGAPYDRWRGRLIAALKFDFAPEERRADRGTALSLAYVFNFQQGADYHELVAKFLHVFEFGFHDLFIRSRGLWIFGAPRFVDLFGLAGSYMRAFFGGAYYVRAAFQLSIEFRVSLYKDMLHLSIFNDFSVFGRLLQGEHQKVTVADAFGPGFHVLLFDVLQIDLNYAFGFAERHFSHNIFFSLKKEY